MSALGAVVTDQRGGRRGTADIKVARRSVARTIGERKSAAGNIMWRSSVANNIEEERRRASTVKEKWSVTCAVEEERDTSSMGNCADCVALSVELKLPL